MADEQPAAPPPSGKVGLGARLKDSFERHKNLYAMGLAAAGLLLTYLIYRQGKNKSEAASPIGVNTGIVSQPTGVGGGSSGSNPGDGGATVPPTPTGGGSPIIPIRGPILAPGPSGGLKPGPIRPPILAPGPSGGLSMHTIRSTDILPGVVNRFPSLN
jgi:hypothetical protein